MADHYMDKKAGQIFVGPSCASASSAPPSLPRGASPHHSASPTAAATCQGAARRLTWGTHSIAQDPNYPVGRARLEGLGVLGCAVIMIIASIEARAPRLPLRRDFARQEAKGPKPPGALRRRGPQALVGAVVQWLPDARPSRSREPLPVLLAWTGTGCHCTKRSRPTSSCSLAMLCDTGIT